ncbi:MAG: thioredoxin domain-containing protein [bacterium]
MKKIIIPILSLIILSGCDFLTDKKPLPKIKSTISNIIYIKDVESFDKIVLNSPKPAVVKFETKWCGACKVMAPIYEKMASKYLDKINFTSVQADQVAELADKYEIQGVPTFLFFKDGKKIEEMIGAVDEVTFEDAIKKLL